MIIELDKLFSHFVEIIEIDEEISFSNDYLSTSEIKELDHVKVVGNITLDQEELFLNLTVSGKMLLEDSISLKDIYYPFTFELNENVEENVRNGENTIDILDILWQNIVLEVPLRYTEVTDYNDYSGDGWKLVSEDEIRLKNNPFSDLVLTNTEKE